VTCAEYSNLIYTAQFEHPEIHDYSRRRGYYFRFEGESHHAGEYQNYFQYFARCLRESRVPKPDLVEGLGTIALLQAMAQSIQRGNPVNIQNLIADYDLADVFP
jgi:predicted dehydrogenase